MFMPVRAHRPLRHFAVVCLAVLPAALAACGAPAPAATPLPPDQLWDTSPTAVIFRADITGGSLPAHAVFSEVPPCTVYGDGRVVWVNELGPFNTEILFDFVTPQRVEQFINYVALNENFYTLDARATQPPDGETAPVVERVTMNVANRSHTADSYGAWDSGWFGRVLAACKTISGAPIRFDPQEAWVRVTETELRPDAPFIFWRPEEHGGVSLAALAGQSEPAWLTGPAVITLWQSLRTLPYSIVFGEGERGYHVGLAVPGVTRDAPPAPAS
jgi:hypothetical protein